VVIRAVHAARSVLGTQGRGDPQIARAGVKYHRYILRRRPDSNDSDIFGVSDVLQPHTDSAWRLACTHGAATYLRLEGQQLLTHTALHYCGPQNCNNDEHRDGSAHGRRYEATQRSPHPPAGRMLGDGSRHQMLLRLSRAETEPNASRARYGLHCDAKNTSAQNASCRVHVFTVIRARPIACWCPPLFRKDNFLVSKFITMQAMASPQ